MCSIVFPANWERNEERGERSLYVLPLVCPALNLWVEQCCRFGILGSGSKQRQLLSGSEGEQGKLRWVNVMNNVDRCSSHCFLHHHTMEATLIWKSFVDDGKITKNWSKPRRRSSIWCHPKKSSSQTQKRCRTNQVLLSVKEDPEANISFWLRPNWHPMDLDHHQCEATLPTTLWS